MLKVLKNIVDGAKEDQDEAHGKLRTVLQAALTERLTIHGIVAYIA